MLLKKYKQIIEHKMCFISHRSLAVVFELVKSDCKPLLQVEGLKMFCEYQTGHGDRCHTSMEFLDQLSSAHGCPTRTHELGGGIIQKTKNSIGARCPCLALLEEPGTRSCMETVVVRHVPLTLNIPRGVL